MKKSCSKQTDHVIDAPGMGLSIIPTSKDKIPYKGWKEFQSVIPPTSYWMSHFKNGYYVGVVCGKVSGNLECIDIDMKNDPKGTIKDEYFELVPQDLLNKLIIQITVNKGYHLIYRCPDAVIENSHKLAWNSKDEVIIETRGEGGFFSTSRSDYKIIQGVLDLEKMVAEVPVITPQERELLLTVARSLTRYFPPAKGKAPAKDNASVPSSDDSEPSTPPPDYPDSLNASSTHKFEYKEPAINKFNDEYDILELFEKHDWDIVREDSEKIYLKRDGTLAPHSGCYFIGTKTFFCFSTSTGFEAGKPYNNFQVLQVLEGKNDYRTTLRLLPDLGFPLSSAPQKGQVTSGSLAKYLNDQGVRYDTFIQDLTLKGKAINELDYNTLSINLKDHFEQNISSKRFGEIILSHFTKKVNRINEFIEKKGDIKPQGIFEQWLDCIELNNSTIDPRCVLYMLKKWYVGMIAQALEGEFPNEFFLCLLSVDQGIGKTTLLRKYLLPEELQCYRKEHSLCLNDDFKVHMGQNLLIIDDEMDGRTWDADKTFKTLLSTKELLTRRKYDRNMSTIHRRCSFAGSGNNLAVVREKLNRRIIPIEIKKIHYDKIAAVNLDDLFMEAYNLYKEGFIYSYQNDDKNIIKQLYMDYMVPNDIDLILDEKIMPPLSEKDLWYITSLDLVSTISWMYPNFSRRINVASIGKMLSERGIHSVRKGKKRLSCYPISSTSQIWKDIDNNSTSYRLNCPDDDDITGIGKSLKLF